MHRFLRHIEDDDVGGGNVAAALATVLDPLSSCRSLQRKGLRMLRCMLAADPVLSNILTVVPLHWRNEPTAGHPTPLFQ